MTDPLAGFATAPDSPGEVVARALQTTGILIEPLQRLEPGDPADSAELARALEHLAAAHDALGRLAGRLFTAEHPAAPDTKGDLPR